MSTAAVDAAAAEEAAGDGLAPKLGKKKLIIILAAVLLFVMLAGGGAAVYLYKKKAAAAAAAAEDDGDETAEPAAVAHAAKKKDAHKAAPTFVPLEPFVVNLADKDTDRFAQIGITLEVEDPKAAEQLKAYMPAIRNGVLLVLAHKTSQQLLQREGKDALAREILRESMLPLGYDVRDHAAVPVAADDDDEDAKKKKKDSGDDDERPLVKNVYFSNFIVQ